MSTADTTENIDMNGWVKREGVTIRCKRVAANPGMDADPKYPMDHWNCTLERNGRDLVLVFSMGSGHQGKQPSAADVVDCLVSDYVQPGTQFEEWCGDFGYDPDSRKAEKTFRACQVQTDKLNAWLDNDPAAIEELLYKVDRL